MRNSTWVAGVAAAIVALSTSYASADRWSGAYAGLSVGYGTSTFQDLDGSATNCWWCINDYGGNVRGFMAGGQFGYNIQSGNVVVGIEGELSGGSLNGGASDPTHPTANARVHGNAFGALAGRLGFASGNMLFYGKAGWGFMNADLSWNDPVYSSFASKSTTVSGAVFGGGIGYAISPTVSLRGDYERFNFHSTKVMDVGGTPIWVGYQQEIRIAPVNVFRLGIDIKIN